MEKEIWKDIPGYEGLYQVSSLGRVKSLDRWVQNKVNGGYNKKGKLLKQGVSKDYYNIVSLCHKGVCNTKKVHKLVAITFLNHKPNNFKEVIDHIDNNKTNNRVDNLQIVTNRENCSKNSVNKTGYIGVTFMKKKNQYRSSIMFNKKRIHIGYYKTAEDASEAYQRELSKINNLQ